MPAVEGWSPYVYGAAITAALVLTYDMLAFALQPFIGVWVDKKNVAAPLLYGSLAAVAVCNMLAAAFDFTNVFGIAVAGLILVSLSNAAFHVSAGAFVIADAKKSAPLGVFVGTGAMGVALGKLLPSGLFFIGAGCLVCCIVLALIRVSGRTVRPYYEQLKTLSVRTEADILPIALICAGVFLRGFCGTAAVAEFETTRLTLVMVAFYAACGKMLGGFLSDVAGVKTAVSACLPLGALLMCFGAGNAALYSMGVMLFNTTMPVTLFMSICALPRYRNAAFGILAALLMVGSVFAMGGGISKYLSLALALCSGVAIVFADIKMKNKNLFAEKGI